MPEASNITPRYLKMGQAMAMTSCCRKTLRKMCECGILASNKTAGGHWRIDKDSIEEHFSGVDQKVLDIAARFGL